ncbi:MAG: DNA polymerase III subunit delta [Chlorobi bacterium]|nr:DNA polymerase III subunit delta [Chlorobiota bacterium]
MTFEQIIQQLKKKEYSPIYFLMGDEPFYIDTITNYIADNVLKEEEKAFNQTIIYGKDTDATNIVLAARRYPMMAPYQVVIVKEAQNIKDIEKLAVYAENPLTTTILVVNYKYKTIDKRKKLYKAISKQGVLFESKKLYDNQVGSWLTSYLKSKGLSIDITASQILIEYLGNDLSKIAHEIEKLQIALGNKTKTITASDIEKNIGISKEFNNFELNKAVLQKNVVKANRIIRSFAKNPKSYPIQVTIATLFGYFQKLIAYHYLKDKSKMAVASALKINPYFVSDYTTGAQKYSARKVVQIISLLREYDMKSKGYNYAATNDGELLKELIFKIMH